MLTVVIKDSGEPKVIQLTYENLYKELKHIPGATIIVEKGWLEALPKIETKYVCFVEADCLVSSGYFDSLIGFMDKHPQQLNKLAVLSTSTGVNNWAVRFYGYSAGNGFTDVVVPNRIKKSTDLPFYTLQVAYIPGALMRTKFLKQILSEVKDKSSDLVELSTELSLCFWRKNWQVYLAPNSTYVTTEDYVNDIGDRKVELGDLAKKFNTESI